MSIRYRTRTYLGSLFLLSVFALSATLLRAQPTAPLTFFKNYFVTGDYAVHGVSLFAKGKDGTATAGIAISGFPEDHVDLLAAFLYVQTVEEIELSGIHQATFNGFNLGSATDSYAKVLNPGFDTRVCYLKDTDPHRMVTYRADVLRFLSVKTNGKHAVNGTHAVSLPDVGFKWDDEKKEVAGTGPHPIGASLVLVYRQRGAPLKAIVIYDGAHTKRNIDTMTQRIAGYYDASSGAPVPRSAKMTHIVGIGTPFLSERVLADGALVARNPFGSASGALWDNWTAPVSLPAHDASTDVSIGPDGRFSDCLTYSAMVLSTNVQDTDNDGLLDVWETAPDLTDPTGQPLPNLAAMGADPAIKNLFFEIGFMHAAEGTTYGGVAKPAHSHLPSLAALNKMGDAFSARNIRVHFDVGAHYQGASPYVVPAAHAKGGKSISETLACLDGAGNLTECLTATGQLPIPGQYPEYPGTVGWKTGFNFLKEELGFDRGRKDIFRYALFAHSLGMPKDPCFRKDANGDFVLDEHGFPESDPTCDTPDFHVPRTNSGIADFPGGDMLITLGAFEDSNGLPIGTDYMQAATLMHESGHNTEFTHAGPPQIPREPNCKPNYLSVMNYLFQLRGLLDADGVPQLDYSGQALPGILETSLSDGPFLSVPYRTGWYAPLATSYLNGFASPASKHCDGSDLLKDGDTFLEPPMVRVDSLGLAGLGIDWNADGLNNLGGIPGSALSGIQDVNFNGLTGTLNDGAEEWSKIRLVELGGRRSPGGFFKVGTRYFMGPLSLDVGRGDIGRGDIGRGDIGRGDIGRGDIGRGDIGRGDIGRGDIGRGDIGRGDIGRGDIGRGDIGRGDFGGGDMDVGAPSELFNGELDFETFIAVTGGQAPTPPSGLQACLTTGRIGACATDGGGDVPVRLTWLRPNVGRAIGYDVYRFTVTPGAAFPPATLPPTPIANVVPIEGPVPTTYLDRTAENGVSYAYFVVARFAPADPDSTPPRSGISNFATITTPALETGIQNVELTSTTLEINGASVPYTATLANGTGEPLSNVGLQGWIEQGDARRAAGGGAVVCGTTAGTLPPGQCVLEQQATASNTQGGTGTLVPGAATAVFQLQRFSGETTTVLDTFNVPITLVAAPPTSAMSVTWDSQPPDTDAGAGFGSTLQVAVLDAATGSAIPGATVVISLDGNPAGVTLGGTRSAVTNADGRAAFANLPINFGGVFRLLASASMVGYAPAAQTSNPFVVEGWGPEFAAPFGGGHEATRLSDEGGTVLLTLDGDTQAVLFDPETRTFTNTGRMNVVRQDHTATLLADGRVLIAGGLQPGAEAAVLGSAEIYDPATGTFTLLDASMLDARYDHRATLLADGRVLFTGGRDTPACCATVAATDLFDPRTGAFSAGPTLANSRHLHTATPLANGTVLIAGGRQGVGTGFVFLESAELYVPGEGIGTIRPTGSLNFARTSHTATELLNGQVLIAGGFGAGGNTTSAEVFNPATSVFLATESGLAQARHLHAAELLANGRVLISGGRNAEGANLTSAERYVPSSGSFVATMSMTTGRTLHQLVQLISGHVLATGGGAGATAQIYYVKPVSF